MIAVVDYLKGNLRSVERGLAAAGGDALVTADPAVIARADAIVLPGVGAFADAAATMWELGQMQVIRERIAEGAPFLGICLGMHLMFEEGREGAPEEDDEESSHNALGLAVLPGVVCALPRVDEAGQAYKIPHVGWNSLVPAACQPPEPLDAAASRGTQSRGADGGLRTKVRGASAITTISGTTETLADLGGPATCQMTERTDGNSVGASACGGVGGAHKASTARAGRPSGLSVRAGLSERLSAADPSANVDAATSFASPLLAGIAPGEFFYFTHSYVAPDTPVTVALTRHSVAFPSVVQYGSRAFGVQFHPEKSSHAGARVLRNFVDIVKGA